MKLTKERGRQLREIWYDIVDHYGPSKFQDNVLELNLYTEPNSNTFGECEDMESECSVNIGVCRTTRQIVEVMIEEYIHYLQSPIWFERYYSMGHTYESHPYEIQAKEIAKRDAHLFLPKK